MPKPIPFAFAFGLGLFVPHSVSAQVAPSIEWQSALGGTDGESAASIQRTVDGGYIVAGVANSNDGDVTGNHGGPDFWIVKLNGLGDLQWQRCLGGGLYEGASEIEQSSDGGYIVIGTTASNDGQVTGNHGGTGDAWIVKLNGAGDIQWQRTIGGTAGDSGTSIQQTDDGGYIMAGGTSSFDGDVVGNHGSVDFFVNRIDADGNLVWSRCYGGSEWEAAQSVKQTGDGGYVVTGNCSSTNGDVVGNHGGYDAWVVKLDPVGDLQWQRALGGSNWEASSEILETSDGGYIVGCSTESNDYDVTGNHGGIDVWVVKLSSNGSIVWEHAIGGTLNDATMAICRGSDEGYAVAGWTDSNDGDVSNNHGGPDFWVVKLDGTGSLQWQSALGGSGQESPNSILEAGDGGFIVAGSASSNDGDVSGNHGLLDAWVVKLGPDEVGLEEDIASRFTMVPNPTGSVVMIEMMTNKRPRTIRVCDATGRTVITTWIANNQDLITLDLSAYENGLYSVELISVDGRRAVELVVKE